MIVRRRYDETRINGFIRLQDMAQRKMADNDDKDCDGSEIIFVKKSTYLAGYKVLHQKKSVNYDIIRFASRQHESLL